MTDEGKSPEACQQPGQDEPGGRQASRLLLTGLFALLGAKVTAFIATHLMMGKQIYESTQRNLTWEMRIKKFLNFGDALGTGKQFKRNLIIAGASTVIGAVGGAVVGLMRGHRIRQPKDIIAHPIKTLGTIAMSERRYQERENAARGNTTPGESTTAWQDKAHQPSGQQHGMDRA